LRSFDDATPATAVSEPGEFSIDEEIYEAQALEETGGPMVLTNADLHPIASELDAEYITEEIKIHPEITKPKMVGTEKEYFRKRAMDEVTGLQMVEHVLSGVEREQMKTVPKPYDDLPVKLALHDFFARWPTRRTRPNTPKRNFA